MIDPKKKRGLRAMDWGILILLAFGIAAVATYALRLYARNTEVVPIVYTLRISGANAAMLQDDNAPIALGNAVHSENGTAALGTVEAIDFSPHLRAVVRNGDIVQASVPDRVDIDVTVRANAKKAVGQGLRVSEIRIAAGAVGGFRIGGYLASQATVIHLREVSADGT